MNYLTILGLISDIAGAILLFFFGLPSAVHQPSKLLLEGDLSDKEKRENKKIERKARIGLFLIILGFVLQLLGTIF